MDITKVAFYIFTYIMCLVGARTVYKTYSDMQRTSNLLDRRKKITTVAEGSILSNRSSLRILEFYGISPALYQSWREKVLYIGFLLTFASLIVDGYVNATIMGVSLLLYYFTKPEDKFLGIRTLTSVIVSSLGSKFNSDVDTEIYSMVTWLHNAALSDTTSLNNPISIAEKLLNISGKTRKVLEKVLDRWQDGDYEGGVIEFSTSLPTPYAMKFAHLLRSIEKSNVSELRTQLQSLQELYRETQFSRTQINQEKYSMVINLPVMMSALFVLLDFVYVTVYISGIDSLMRI